MKDLIVNAIKTPAQHETALKRVSFLMGAVEAFSAELEALSALVWDYEQKHFPVDAPTAVDAIRFRMEQTGITQAKLARMIGLSSSKVSEMLSGKRGISKATIVKINKTLGIPVDILMEEL